MAHTVTDRSLALNDVHLHTRDWGGSGVPVVLLHGLASTGHIWDLVAPLLARSQRVVALDQRGHGESDKPDGDFSFEATVGDLRALIDALGLERPIVVGHSWGGSVALAYGAAFPKEPRGLVLVDGGTSDLQARFSWEEALAELSPPPLAGMTLEDFKARMRAWMPDALQTPEVERIVLANFQVDAEQRISPRLSREHHLRILRALWEQRPSDLYEQVACPVLVLPARWPVRDDTERLAAKVRGVALAQERLAEVQVRWFEDTLHDVPLHRPAELAKAISAFSSQLA